MTRTELIAHYDEVICPNCITQFRAIPEDVQSELIQLREAAQLALDALEMYCEHGAIAMPIFVRDALKEALK